MKPRQPLPRHPEKFAEWREKVCRDDVMTRIEGILVFQVNNLLSCYYGSYYRAAWGLFKHAINETTSDLYWRYVYRICDWVGWTKIRVAPWSEDQQSGWRHSAKCDKLNCGDIHCVQRGIPQWYKSLTGIEPYFEEGEE